MFTAQLSHFLHHLIATPLYGAAFERQLGMTAICTVVDLGKQMGRSSFSGVRSPKKPRASTYRRVRRFFAAFGFSFVPCDDLLSDVEIPLAKLTQGILT
jgi:hypothetical protein